MLKNLYGNVMAVVDVETTGTVFGYHEIIQIAILPLDQHLEQSKEHRFFYMEMAPKHPERQSVGAKSKHGMDAYKMSEECVSQEQAADLLDKWFLNLNLPVGKRLVPLAHNWAFERGFLTHWLGIDQFDSMWHMHPRDTMTLAASLNDVYVWQGMNPPFHALSLTGMCKRFGIPLENAHNALADCVATAELYKAIVRSFMS